MKPQPRPNLKCWNKAAKHDPFWTSKESGIITQAYGFSLIKRFLAKIRVNITFVVVFKLSVVSYFYRGIYC